MTVDLAGMMVIQDEEQEVVHLRHGGKTLGYLTPMAAYRLALLLSDAARSLAGKQIARTIPEQPEPLSASKLAEQVAQQSQALKDVGRQVADVIRAEFGWALLEEDPDAA